VLNPNSAVPVYRQLADLLRAQIDSGDLGPGMPLPSEVTLVNEHGISRDTVRKAIGILREEGLVVTVQGKGSYVVDRSDSEPSGSGGHG
jgi:GntR family transcriptional regulator